MGEILNIVNENDEIIGERSREEIHRDGLAHREIHVYFVTPNKELVFQHRAKDKETYPDLLDASVGGHVEIGDSYLKTAIKETEEETGLKIEEDDLILMNKTKKYSKDPATGKINNAIRESFVYIFKGDISDLKEEEGSGIGFELWPIDKLFKLNIDEEKRFIPYILEFSKTEVFKFINNLKI